jgi:hypothetical protein
VPEFSSDFPSRLQKYDPVENLRKRIAYSELFVVFRPSPFIISAFRQRKAKSYDIKQLGQYLHHMIVSSNKPTLGMGRILWDEPTTSFIVEHINCPTSAAVEYPFRNIDGEAHYPPCSHDFLRTRNPVFAGYYDAYSPIPIPNTSFEQLWQRGMFLISQSMSVGVQLIPRTATEKSRFPISRTLRLRWIGAIFRPGRILNKMLRFSGEHVLKVELVDSVFVNVKFCFSQGAYAFSKLVENQAAFELEFESEIAFPDLKDWPAWVPDEEDQQKGLETDADSIEIFNARVVDYVMKMKSTAPISTATAPAQPVASLEQEQEKAKQAALLRTEQLKRTSTSAGLVAPSSDHAAASMPDTALEAPSKRRKLNEGVSESKMDDDIMDDS